ncbi:MAG: acetyl-CoA C-acyltransferase, partial [Thermodesulfobacteriota bacterium]
MREAVLVSACRTAIGAFNGSLKETTATDLGKIAILEAIRRAGVDQGIVDEVIMGCVLPAGLGQNPARQAMLKAGLDVMVGAITVNKVCGSGLKAVMLAAQAIQAGDAEVIVAGGMENMNLAPYYLLKGRYGERMGHGQVFDSMVYDGLWDHLNGFLMGVSAELCAEKYGVTRADQDNFAFTSYRRALAAQAAGVFAAEITPVKIASKKGEVDFVQDEILKPTSLDDLAKLRPAFKKDGTVTPGNASKISDGAAAVVVMSADKARSLGLKPLARVVSQASAGIDPKYVLVAPIYAIPKCCAKAGLKPQDVDVYEINQAFSASSVAVQRHLDLDPDKIDAHGGAVALGHPIGASGARVLVSLLSA